MVGVAQLVERLVVVQDVEGSSPFTHPTVGSRHSHRPQARLVTRSSSLDDGNGLPQSVPTHVPLCSWVSQYR